jgi:TonB family protein
MDFFEQLEKGRLGSFELKRQVGPNMLKGLLISLLIHSTVIASPFLIAKLFLTDEAIPKPPGDGGIIYVQPKLQQMDPDLVTTFKVKPPSTDVTKKVDLIPVPPEDLDSDAPLLADQGKLKHDLGSAPLPDTGGEGGPKVVYRDPPPDDPIPDKPIFIPFEIGPQAVSGCPQPAYPDLAKTAKLPGKVTIQVFVDKTGNVKKWQVVKADPKGLGFEQEVEKVIGRWKFTPALQQGSPVGVWVAIPFNFSMK